MVCVRAARRVASPAVDARTGLQIMKAPPSKLHQSMSAEERDFDEILRLDSPTQETSRFLPPSNDPEPPLRRAKHPIPANRIALIRQIEEERAELRRRARLRDLGKMAMITLAIVVNLAALVVLFWLLYEAAINGPVARGKLGHQQVIIDAAAEGKPRILGATLLAADRPERPRIVVMPKKLAHMRTLGGQRPTDSSLPTRAE